MFKPKMIQVGYWCKYTYDPESIFSVTENILAALEMKTLRFKHVLSSICKTKLNII